MVIITGREAGRLDEVEAQILTPGRIWTHRLVQVGAYLTVFGPLRVQIFLGVDKGI